MRIIKYIFILIMLLPMVLTAQSYNIEPGTIEHNGAIVQSVRFDLNLDKLILQNKFEEWVEQKYNINLEERELIFFEKNVLEARAIRLDDKDNRQLDLYIRVDQENEDRSNMHLYASFGYNNWIGIRKDPTYYNTLKNMGLTFIKEYLPDFYLQKIKDNRALLDDLIVENVAWENEVENNKILISDLTSTNEKLMHNILVNKEKIYAIRKALNEKIEHYNDLKDDLSDSNQ